MKYTAYTVRTIGDTVRIHGGRAVDLDLQGGLEEILTREMQRGNHRIAVNLQDMCFLHATLYAGLLSTALKLRRLNGSLFLVHAPEFVEWSMRRMGVHYLFDWVDSENALDRLTSLRSMLREEFRQPDTLRQLAEQLG